MGYNEADTRAKLINPKLHEAGWSEDLIRREITAGTIEIINGKTIRKKGRMDYLLCLPVKEGENPLSIAVLEAKKEDEHATLGLEQAKEYAKRLNAPFVFSTNGHLFVEYDYFEENKYCKIFDNEVFGYTKVIVERPLQLNYQVSKERLENLYSVKAFACLRAVTHRQAKLAESKKKNPELKLKEEEEGRKKQEEIINALEAIGNNLYKNWDEFEVRVKEALKGFDLSPNFIKNIILALSEHDDTADYVLDKKGNKLPDSNLRDSEKIPLKQDIEEYFEKEVKPYYPDLPAPRPKPNEYCIYVLKCNDNSFYIGQTNNFERRLVEHNNKEISWTANKLPIEPIHWEIFKSREDAVKREKELKAGFGRKWLKREYNAGRLKAASRQAGAWMDRKKDKIGYEINFTKYFYEYKPPRPLEEIEKDIKEVIGEIQGLLKDEL